MSIYAITYQGGFALPKSLEELDYLMKHNTNISVREFTSLWEAYCSCCYKRSKDKLKDIMNSQTMQQPLMPTFEAVCQMPFHEPGFIENVSPNRVFAVIHLANCGIYYETQTAIEFLNFYHPSWLKEFATLGEAQWWINCKHMSRIFPMGAYIQNDIPYLNNIQPNLVIPTNYDEWLKENLQVPQEFSFTSNQFLLSEHN